MEQTDDNMITRSRAVEDSQGEKRGYTMFYGLALVSIAVILVAALFVVAFAHHEPADR
jgi:hypothetical protein